MTQSSRTVSHKVGFDENGVPTSEEFGDVFFSAEDGLAETHYVFFESNQLEERLKKKSRVSVGELGFGTGLNFLATWALQRKCAPQTRLIYFSVEKFPLAHADLKRALSRWSEIAPVRDLFLNEYRDMSPGFHHFIFDRGKVELTLAIGDVDEMLSELQSGDGIDAWYLDGFAPSKNPGMWGKSILEKVAFHSGTGATFGTFTSVGQVRRDLESVGFKVEKVKGFSRKREMLRGIFTREKRTSVRPEREIKIVGGGIAGTALADALARRGARSVIFERRSELASEASGNPIAVIKPMLSAVPTAISELTLRGTAWVFRRMRELQDVAYSQCGAFHIPEDEEKTVRFKRGLDSHSLPQGVAEWIDAAEASRRTGIPCKVEGLWYHEAGWVAPRELSRAYVASHSGEISTIFGREILRQDLENGHWIWAGGVGLRDLVPEMNLKLRKVWGQLSSYPETQVSSSLKAVIHYGGYITPSHLGYHVVGSTHHREGTWAHDFDDTRPQIEEDRVIFDRLVQSFPDLGFDLCAVQGRAALRAATPDSLPLAGELSESGGVTSGHGSRGMIYAAISAEILASKLTGEFTPIETRLIQKLDPLRLKKSGKNN